MLSPGLSYSSDSRQWTGSAHGQYSSAASYDGFNTSNPVPSITGFQANPQNYPWGSPYLVNAFASGESPDGTQVAQVPAPNVSRYYTQTMYPSVPPSTLGWTSTYSVTDTAAPFGASNGGQNANLYQASHYVSPEAYAYGRDMVLESPSTMRSSTGRNTFGEMGFGTGYMTSYSDTMPEPSEYYRPE